MTERHAILTYLFGFMTAFAGMLLLVCFASSMLFGKELLPIWVIAMLMPLGIMGIVALLTVFFLKGTAKLSRNIEHDNSHVSLKEFARSQKRPARIIQ